MDATYQSGSRLGIALGRVSLRLGFEVKRVKPGRVAVGVALVRIF
jgi:hypothetical protein